MKYDMWNVRIKKIFLVFKLGILWKKTFTWHQPAVLNNISLSAWMFCHDFFQLFDIHLLLWNKLQMQNHQGTDLWQHEKFMRIFWLQEQTSPKLMLNAFIHKMKSNFLLVEGAHWAKRVCLQQAVYQLKLWSVAESCAKSKAPFLCQLLIPVIQFSLLLSSTSFISSWDFPMQDFLLVSDVAANLYSE